MLELTTRARDSGRLDAGLRPGAARRLYDNGTVSRAARQQLQRGLDLEAARLSHEQR
jgi:hypothetical protein